MIMIPKSLISLVGYRDANSYCRDETAGSGLVMIDGTGTPEEDGIEPIVSLVDASLGSELIETSNAIIVGLDLHDKTGDGG